MLKIVENPQPPQTAGGFTRGTVAGFGDLGVLVISGREEPAQWQVWAQPLGRDRDLLEEGDSVLICGEGEAPWFVVGVVESKRPDRERLVQLQNGARATVNDHDDGQVLKLFSDGGGPVMEYDTASGKIRLFRGQGDLELVADGGDLVLQAAGKVCIDSGAGVDIDSDSGLCLSSGDSQVTVGPEGIGCAGPRFGVTGHDARVSVAQGSFTGQRLRVGADEAYLVVGRFESVCRDVVQKAKNLYSVVEDLVQSRAGRMRTVVKSSYHLKGENVAVRGTEDVKVKSDKIHLG